MKTGTQYRDFGVFDDPRYKVIPTRGADLLYDAKYGIYYKQFRLPFPERKESDEHLPQPKPVE